LPRSSHEIEQDNDYLDHLINEVPVLS